MRGLFLILISVGILSSCQSLNDCLLAPCDSVDEASSLPFSLEEMRLALTDPISINATTEFYPNVPLSISLKTNPEQNETWIIASSCNSQAWGFEGLTSINYKTGEPATLMACTDQLRTDTDTAIAGMASEFKSFQIEDGHLTLKDENQQVLIKAKLVGDDK